MTGIIQTEVMILVSNCRFWHYFMSSEARSAAISIAAAEWVSALTVYSYLVVFIRSPPALNHTLVIHTLYYVKPTGVFVRGYNVVAAIWHGRLFEL